MSESKDNVKVAIRIRPLSAREIDEGEVRKCAIAQVHKNSVLMDMKPESKVFTYDFVADEDISQDQMFQVVGKPIATACLSGYNGTIFAYGQTGAGKTFTINGLDPEAPDVPEKHELRGILPRCVEFIFSSISKEMKKPGVEFLVKCSYLEIYQEQVMDLLGETGSLQLREDIKRGVYVDGLVEQTVMSVPQALELIREGTRNRHVGATSMNKESSRSHSVFTMIIESKETFTGVLNFKSSCFHLIDLAGSERQKSTDAAGERLKEAGMINKSLSALGNVINSLVEVAEGRNRHVHYRDSKLTFLLKDSLGGNAKTCIIANISPSIAAFGETLSTLKFAQRAKLIKNKAIINEDTSGNVAVLKEEIRRLKAELAACRLEENSSPKQGTDYSLLILNDRVKQLESLLEHNVRIRQETETVLQREIGKKEEQIDLLNSTVGKYEKKLSHDKMIIKLREATIARLQSGQGCAEGEETEALTMEIQSLKELVDAHPQAAKLFAENERLKQHLEELKGELGGDPFSLTYRLKESQEFTKQLAASLQESALEREQLKAMLVEYEKYKTGELFPSPVRRRREEEITKVKLEYCERIDALTQSLNEERRRRQEAESKLPGMQIDSEDSLVERKLKALEAEMDAAPMQSSFYLLDGQLGEDDERLSNLEQKLAEMKEQLDHRETEVMQLKQEADIMHESNAFLETQLAEVRQILDEKKSHIAQLQTIISTLESDKQRQDELLHSLQSTSEGSPLNLALSENRELSKENAELKAEVQLKEIDLRKAVEDVRTLESKLDSAEAKEQADKSTLVECQRKIGLYRSQVSSLEAEVQSLRSEIHIYEDEQRRISEQLTELSVLQAQNQLLSSGLFAREKELEAAKGALAEAEVSKEQMRMEMEHGKGQDMATIGMLTEQLKDAQVIIEEMQAENERLSSENSDLKSGFEVDSQRKSWFSDLDTSSQFSFEVLRAELTATKEENENLREENFSKMQMLKSSNRSLATNRPEAELWKKTIEEKNALISSLKQQLLNKEEDLAHANQLLSKLNFAFAANRSSEELETEVKTLKGMLANKEAEVRDLRETRAAEATEAQKKEVEAIGKKYTLLQTELVRVKEELRVSVLSRESLIEEMKKARTDQNALQQDCEETKESLRRALAEKSKAYKEIEALTRENEKLVGHNNISQKIKFHGRVKEENNQLKQQNFKLSEDLQRMQLKCEAYQRKLEEMRRKGGLPYSDIEVDDSQAQHTLKLQDEIRNLSDGLTKISDFVFNLPIVSFNPVETSIVDSTIKAISALYEALEAREVELREKDRELHSKASKLSILENEHLLWKQKLELQQLASGLRTPGQKSRGVYSTPGSNRE